ncbi:hypothetical protein MMC29_001076 [Sticta canariensis]|nr:hypothetical protein [Sticta canariensis]
MTRMESNLNKGPTPASGHEFDPQNPDVEARPTDTVKLPTTDSPRPIVGWRWGLAGKYTQPQRNPRSNPTNTASVSAILSSVFFSLDQTIVADIIPNIVDHFGQVQKLPWVSVTLLLAAAGTINFWAKMYGQFDPKWLYIICVLGFEIGSAVCGAPPSMKALIIGRAIAGLGRAGMYLGVIMLLSIFTTQTERPASFAMLGGTFGLGTAFGPIVGGAFADSSATWRWAFYINLCIGGLFSPIYFFYIPSSDFRPGASILSRCREIDYTGILLQIGAFVSGIMAVSFGGVLYEWFHRLDDAAESCFPTQYVTIKEMAIVFSQIAAASTNSFIAIYFIPLFFQFVQSDQTLRSGTNSKYYLPWFLVGGILIIISNAMLFHISLTISTTYVYAALVLGGLGTGLFVNAPFAIAQWIVPPEEIAEAVGFVTCAQVAGVTISLAMGNAVFLNLAENSITSLLPGVAKTDVQAAITGLGGKFLRTLDAETQEMIWGAIVDAI